MIFVINPAALDGVDGCRDVVAHDPIGRRCRDVVARYLADRQALRTLTLRVADGASTLPASGALTTWWRSIGAVPSRRVADLCAHLLCNRPGLTYTEERYARPLAARAAADNLVRVE